MILNKIFKENEFKNSWAIILSASIGAFAFTFSDSFWFNAVETEVYALAMLFLSSTFWAGLRWDKDFENERGDKWLLLISFLIGLSFGVHFMAILTIPAIGMIYYFRKYKDDDEQHEKLPNLVEIQFKF